MRCGGCCSDRCRTARPAAGPASWHAFLRCRLADLPAHTRSSHVKILTVEDDLVARAVLRQALRQLGHETLEATDGVAALDMLQKHEGIRVVVSDWTMPNSDGLTLCRNIRKRVGAEYTYFILLTSRDATEENQTEAADAGVDDFLTKPLDFAELWMRLRVAERILRYTTQVRQLEEMLPICSYCKKIRDDQNYWRQLEGYISERTGSDFSHSICPDCYTNTVMPEIQKMKVVAKPKPSVERKH
jgi:sigma-B regulation protein RsbU (phosphoserine phosphatase)